MSSEPRADHPTAGQGRSLAAAGASVFAYSLFISMAELPAAAAGMPQEQWQGALAYRPLTPQEQAAREAYFERRIAEALAHVRTSD